MGSPRDPEVARLAVENLKLIVRAERLYHELEDHNDQLATFLQRLTRYTDQEDRDGRP